jgi:DNA repair exonuclease SbcCD nuclease subunit
MESEYVEVEKEYDSKKTLYQEVVAGQTNVEALISQLQVEFDNTQDVVLAFVAEMQRGLKRLSEIALKKDPLQQVDYLDLLIQSEEMQAKPGFKERVNSLQETRKRAEEINRMAKPSYDPWEKYRENEETRKFLSNEQVSRESNQHVQVGLFQRFFRI